MASAKKPASESPWSYQDRAFEEKVELDERIKKLEAFQSATQFHALPEAEKSRQMKQLQYMRRYSDILGERIHNFPTPPTVRDRGAPPAAKTDEDLGLE